MANFNFKSVLVCNYLLAACVFENANVSAKKNRLFAPLMENSGVNEFEEFGNYNQIESEEHRQLTKASGTVLYERVRKVTTKNRNNKESIKLRKVEVKTGDSNTRIKTIYEKECGMTSDECDSDGNYDKIDEFVLDPPTDCGLLQGGRFEIELDYDIKRGRAMVSPCDKHISPYNDGNLFNQVRQYLNNEHPKLAGSNCAAFCEIAQVTVNKVSGTTDLSNVVPEHWCALDGRLEEIFGKAGSDVCTCKPESDPTYTKGCAKCEVTLDVALGKCYNRNGSSPGNNLNNSNSSNSTPHSNYSSFTLPDSNTSSPTQPECIHKLKRNNEEFCGYCTKGNIYKDSNFWSSDNCAEGSLRRNGVWEYFWDYQFVLKDINNECNDEFVFDDGKKYCGHCQEATILADDNGYGTNQKCGVCHIGKYIAEDGTVHSFTRDSGGEKDLACIERPLPRTEPIWITKAPEKKCDTENGEVLLSHNKGTFLGMLFPIYFCSKCDDVPMEPIWNRFNKKWSCGSCFNGHFNDEDMIAQKNDWAFDPTEDGGWYFFEETYFNLSCPDDLHPGGPDRP